MLTPSTPIDAEFSRIVELLSLEEFEIPRSQPNSSDVDFPTYLKSELDRYTAYYTADIKPLIDAVRLHGQETQTPLESKILQLTTGIKAAVDYYYQGKLLRATQGFQNTLDSIGFIGLISVETFQPGRIFYRTRHSSDRHLTKKELFHNPFENRGIVATSRYSIPGLPALYLGDSTYVCWEEYNKKDFKNLYFSRFHNKEPLKVVKIQRLVDLISQLQEFGVSSSRRMTYLSRYLSLFPLSIACSIRTKSNTDTFKPEYIIPQLLLQYVTDKDKKDAAGIMFPSTKVDYSKIKGVPAYNYVFPVKQIQSTGYCSDLVRTFELTEPTSTELESLTNFSGMTALTIEEGEEMITNPKYISIMDGEGSSYITTAFGFLERVLEKRKTGPLIN